MLACPASLGGVLEPLITYYTCTSRATLLLFASHEPSIINHESEPMRSHEPCCGAYPTVVPC